MTVIPDRSCAGSVALNGCVNRGVGGFAQVTSTLLKQVQQVGARGGPHGDVPIGLVQPASECLLVPVISHVIFRHAQQE